MRNTKMPLIFTFLFICAFSGPFVLASNEFSIGCRAMTRACGWTRELSCGLTYHPAGNGGNIQVDIKAEQPVTIF